MYQKYSTHAIVLGSREYGEADTTLALFTEDFGLVWVRASGMRLEKSKMRTALQRYSGAHVSLVRGVRGWRAAGAVSEMSAMGRRSEALGAYARISELVLRLVRGEERNDYLFSTLKDAQHALFSDQSDLASIEIVCVARVLYALGYLSAEALQTTLFTHTAYGVTELSEVSEKREDLLASINRAIAETHL